MLEGQPYTWKCIDHGKARDALKESPYVAFLQANYILDLARHFDGGLLSDEAIAGMLLALHDAANSIRRS